MILEFLTKAEENLDIANVALERGKYNAAANRAYYASFQATVAALAAEGIKHSGHRIPHEWLQAQFSGILITRRKRYPSHFASYLPKMQDLRDDADYKTLLVSKNDATQQVKKANEFVLHILAKLQ